MTGFDAPVSGRAAVPAAEFSVRGFARSAHGSHRDDLHLEAYSVSGLDPAMLESIDLLSRLERSALTYLRSVLVTPTHADARMTAFLVTWAYEKYWLADALELIVNAHGARQAPTRTTRVGERLRFAWNRVAERLEPIRESVVANLLGDDVVAAHCAIGAVDELITHTAYQRLAAATEHDQLRTTLTSLQKVKRRHGEFFTAQARDRLTSSPRARSLTRRRLRRAELPLGARDEPAPVMARFLGGLVTGSDIAAIDHRVDALPGLAGLQLATRAAATTDRRARRGPGSTRKAMPL